MIPFFAFPPEVRRLIYQLTRSRACTAQLRKIIKDAGHFPNDGALPQTPVAALRNLTAQWKPTAYGTGKRP